MSDTMLVTGGAGFIGSHMVERLLDRGHRVICLDNFDSYYDPAIKRENLRPAMGKEGFTLVEGDIRDRELLNKLLSQDRIKVVVHLAAMAGVRPSIERPAIYEEVNVQGTINLLEACKGSGIERFVFASSSSVYGADAKAPFSEEVKVDHPASPYAASKAAGELFCYTYHQLCGFPVIALRFFTVYGPRQRPEMAIHKFTRLIHQGKVVPLYGEGRLSRDFTYIADVVDGIEAALTRPITGFEVINLGNSHPVEVKYIVELIEKHLGRKARIELLPTPQGDVPMTSADISRARWILGYEPKVSLQEGIGLFAQWYLECARNSAPTPQTVEVER